MNRIIKPKRGRPFGSKNKTKRPTPAVVKNPDYELNRFITRMIEKKLDVMVKTAIKNYVDNSL